MDKFSFVGNSDVNAVENLYQQYKLDPSSVDESWAHFFEGIDFSRKLYDETGGGQAVPENVSKEFKVIDLINDYRSRGHLFTQTNPVRERRKYEPSLAIENYGLSATDLEETFQAGTELGIGPAKLKDIVNNLELTYCSSTGVEYMYIRHIEEREWLRKRFESTKNQPSFSNEEKKRIFNSLTEAVVFESFLHKKFVGQKRFSLEGGESLIPALETIIQDGSRAGVEEIVIGMAHRGRLNVLANVMRKSYSEIFSEFEGKDYEDNLFDGDVKYHLGYSSTFDLEEKRKMTVTLAPNPSHLEAVDGVVEGISRAKLDTKLKDESKIIPVLIHGDASIAGQGVVYEVVQMAQLDSYRNGGTIHIVVNNQLGFTTNYKDGRSSVYCTDVGKVTLSPIFHVNGDDVEAVSNALTMAVEYRQKFKKDVFIDLLCYRKYGHNEGDEPRFTQPLLYKAISKHPNPRNIYIDKLIEQGLVTKARAKELEKEFNDMLQGKLEEAQKLENANIELFMKDVWDDLKPAANNAFDKSPNTSITKAKLKKLGANISELDESRKFFKKSLKLFKEREKMIKETEMIDWAMGEMLAYASLLDEGHPVRMTGQDIERGTFSHRHAVLKLEDSEEEYRPLEHVSDKQADAHFYNSLLSEYAVLAFEYGYALANPNALTIWEAQFGDFFNGAQIVVDQFISAGEDKWKVQNGLVMLLPHGYEGQGAEHSSARLERFLEACAEDNIQIVNCSTPANMFHILRRQLKRDFRKPLIVFTPKSLLRHPQCMSSLDELSKGGFQEVINDPNATAAKVKRVVMCSGKLYYDILAKAEEEKRDDLAVVRIEQLYPFPEKQLEKVLSGYKKAEEFIWAQEEPENMGAWSYMLRKFQLRELKGIHRHESSSPASGSSVRFKHRQQEILDKIFA